MERFRDRVEAGKLLAIALKSVVSDRAVVFGLPRGGVIVAAEVAKALNCPLRALVARKVGHPKCPEYAVAAVTNDGSCVRNESECLRLDPTWLSNAMEREVAEARRRESIFGLAPCESLVGAVAVIIDDGMATGLTVLAAALSVRKLAPSRVVVAVPVTSAEAARAVRESCDEVISLLTPLDFRATGAHYDDFRAVSDAEVLRLLRI